MEFFLRYSLKCKKATACIIEAKCTDNILFAGAAAVGAVVLVFQSFPIFMNNWVFLTEPRPINKTNENGEQMESTFHYNAGYFQVCRMHKNNQTGVLYSEYEVSRKCFHLSDFLQSISKRRKTEVGRQFFFFPCGLFCSTEFLCNIFCAQCIVRPTLRMY
uniref:Transmembrane protein n=1 Tax=Angiostrongylus cantonensis TaxID=6313 RepID=A0A0K0D6A9_ANGCA